MSDLSDPHLGPGRGPAPPTWYHATANPAPVHPPLAGDVTADVCVIGGGLAGVSAALNLAERGYRVVLLEAERVGYGASGRNGGQIVNGFSCDMSVFRDQLGETAAAEVWRMGREALEDVEARVKRHKIACDLRWGYFYAAVKPRHLRGLAEMAADWERRYGYDEVRLVERDMVQSLIGTTAYVGGLVDRNGGQLHPLNYLLGLADTARFLGVTFHEGSRVERIEPGAKPVVRTPGGSVTADFLVLCCNAYLDRLSPAMARRIAPVASFVGVTEPLDPVVAEAAFPQDVAVADTNTALNYFRRTADDRLLFGAGANYRASTPARLKPYLSGKIGEIYPRLRSAPLEHAWSGFIAITRSRAPDWGRLTRNIYYAQGFSGHGVALTGLAGKLIAEAIAGQSERFDVFAGVRHARFPGGPLRTAALVLAMSWFKLRDRLW